MKKENRPWLAIGLLAVLGGGVIAMRQAQPVVGSVDELNERYQKQMEAQQGKAPASPLGRRRDSPASSEIAGKVETALRSNRPLPTKAAIALILNQNVVVKKATYNPAAPRIGWYTPMDGIDK